MGLAGARSPAESEPESLQPLTHSSEHPRTRCSHRARLIVRQMVCGWGGETEYLMISVQPGLSPTGQRRFPIGYRLEFLREWDAAARERGARARLLRENDLSQATVRRWIGARDRGELEESMMKASKRNGTSASVDRAELARLRVENEQLRRQVVQAEAAQDILGKAFELLQGINESSQNAQDPQIPPALMSATEYAAWLQRLKLS